MNKEPSSEQIKRFWEWCGFKPTRLQSGNWGWLYPPEYSLELGHLPPIDLNNLFKYAVPKVAGLGKFHGISFSLSSLIESEWTCEVIRTWHRETETDKDPALALFWAIYKVIEND